MAGRIDAGPAVSDEFGMLSVGNEADILAFPFGRKRQIRRRDQFAYFRFGKASDGKPDIGQSLPLYPEQDIRLILRRIDGTVNGRCCPTVMSIRRRRNACIVSRCETGRPRFQGRIHENAEFDRPVAYGTRIRRPRMKVILDEIGDDTFERFGDVYDMKRDAQEIGNATRIRKIVFIRLVGMSHVNGRLRGAAARRRRRCRFLPTRRWQETWERSVCIGIPTAQMSAYRQNSYG